MDPSDQAPLPGCSGNAYLQGGPIENGTAIWQSQSGHVNQTQLAKYCSGMPTALQDTINPTLLAMPPVHGDQLSSRLDAYTGHEAESVDSARGVHVGNANGPAVDSTYWAKPQADTRSFLEPTDQDQLDDTEAQIPSFCNFETDLNECRVADNANVETFVGFGKARKIANFENTAPPADRHTNPTIHVQPYDLRSLARTPSVNYFQIPTDEELEPPQKRRRTRQSNRGPPKPIFNGVERRVCSEMDCGKFVPINRDGPRCTRCHQKWIKNTTGPQHVDFDPSIEMSQAYDLVYTPQPPLKMEYGLEDDVAGQTIASTASDRWMTFLFDSINSPYVVQETHTHEWIHSNFLTQQQVYNKKFFDQPEQYNRRMINARLRFLFVSERVHSEVSRGAELMWLRKLLGDSTPAAHWFTTMVVTTPGIP